MKFFKAFNKGMICNGKKYEENTVYEEDGKNICGPGVMHFCETPFDTLDYYPLVDDNGDFSKFAEVEPMEKVIRRGNKCASKKIKIGAKLSFKQFVNAAVNILIEKTRVEGDNNMSSDNGKFRAQICSSEDFARIGSSGGFAQIDSSGNNVQIGSSGDCSQIGSSGRGAQIGSSGNRTKIGSSGNFTRIGSSGDHTQIGSSGDYVQIGSSGNVAQIGSSGDYAQIGSSEDWTKIGSSGNWARISSSGDYTLIGSSGDLARIALKGKKSIAAAVGYKPSIKGKKGDWIVLAEWKQDDYGWYPASVKTGQIDGDILKEDVFYHLENGEFVEE